MAKISEIYNLNKSQSELDFIDIDPDMDIPLFLDPFFLSRKQDRWSIEATDTIKTFFQSVLNATKNKDRNKVKKLFYHLSEPNATCLGLSRGKPSGRGVGVGDSDKIYANFLKSKAVETGLVKDIEDSVLFVENFGKDKLSDMVTNIIKIHLLDYTKSQCIFHNIPTISAPSTYFWDKENNYWHNKHIERLIAEDKAIILVPKGIVSFASTYTPEKYYQHFVLNFLQNEHLDMGSSLVEKRKNGTPYVTKKNLKEQVEYEFSKEFLRKFTQEHPEVLEDFKNNTEKNSLNSLKNYEIANKNVYPDKKELISKLKNIQPGTKYADEFHNTILGILTLLFYPHLIIPTKEQKINQGRKRIDIVFVNSAESGFFKWVSNTLKVQCPYVFVECKNYSTDISNPELDQLVGRFSSKRGEFGFVVCRKTNDIDLLLKRCKDLFNDGKGLILPLTDNDVIFLIENYNEPFNNIDTFLYGRTRDIVSNQ